MYRIMFVCHGNICRSPMAEFVLWDMVNEKGLADLFEISSSGTSQEELGNPVHKGTKKKLMELGICTDGKFAVQLKKEDYEHYDYLIGMDQNNIFQMKKIIGLDPMKKMKRLLDFTDSPRDIADPWYTCDFDQAYRDIYEGCKALLYFILN